MRAARRSNSINRVLKARGLPSLDEPGVIEALAFQVEDHQHFTELLRACDPLLRRAMYEAMSPNLRFSAKPLEYYIMAAKEHAEAAQLPVMDAQGLLHPFREPVIITVEAVPPFELRVKCGKCQKAAYFVGDCKGSAIFAMRTFGWAYDESASQKHLCPECLDAVD